MQYNGKAGLMILSNKWSWCSDGVLVIKAWVYSSQKHQVLYAQHALLVRTTSGITGTCEMQRNRPSELVAQGDSPSLAVPVQPGCVGLMVILTIPLLSGFS